MNEYLISLICVCAVVAVATFIAYNPTDRTLGVALAVILSCTSVGPIIRVVLELGEEDIPLLLDGIQDTDIPLCDTEYAECAEDAFCLGIRRAVCEGHSLASSDVSVSAVDFDVGTMRAKKIKIVLSGDAVTADSRAIEEELEEGGLGECEVILELSG